MDKMISKFNIKGEHTKILKQQYEYWGGADCTVYQTNCGINSVVMVQIQKDQKSRRKNKKKSK